MMQTESLSLEPLIQMAETPRKAVIKVRYELFYSFKAGFFKF